jgi:hypothetical protein
MAESHTMDPYDTTADVFDFHGSHDDADPAATFATPLQVTLWVMNNEAVRPGFVAKVAADDSARNALTYAFSSQNRPLPTIVPPQ